MLMSRKIALGMASFVLLPFLLGAQDKVQSVNWRPLAWLIGDWTGTGGGGPGQGNGSFSFHHDLQEHVLLRKSFSEYPAVAGKPAYRHDDLMVIYPADKGFRADYFDNEGHMIRYVIDVSPDGNIISLMSDETPSGPRFRLTYHKTGENTLEGTFAIAPPGKPREFAKYLEWTAQKQAIR